MVFNESVVEEYYACPNCLSKVASLREKTVVDEEAEVEEGDASGDVGDVDFGFGLDAEEVAEPVTSVEESDAVGGGGDVAGGCLHGLGYLKKRGKNVPIPEECLTCSKMIDCMY
jgi:hypothetical protein